MHNMTSWKIKKLFHIGRTW